MRTVRNVHQRVIEAPAEQVGALLDLLSSRDDPLFPTPAWPAMRFDRPLSVGADGGHGPVRYSVAAYEPGRRIRFDFAPPADGFHQLDVEPLGPTRCRVRHVLEGRHGLPQALLWALVVRPVHETVAEELLDNVEWALVPGAPAEPVRWSRRVRLLNGLLWDRPVEVEVPALGELGRRALGRVDFADAWQMPLRPGMTRDPGVWSDVLPFPVKASSAGELLLGRDRFDLVFRVSVRVDEGADTVTCSTYVQFRNPLGRAYLAVARLGRPWAVRLLMRRAHRRLALAAPSAGERHRQRVRRRGQAAVAASGAAQQRLDD